MNPTSRNKKHLALLLGGDSLTLALVTMIGFASHGTLGSAGVRMVTTFAPLVVAWFLVAPFMGLYDLSLNRDVRNLWRPVYAMLIAAPFAAWLRGVLLNEPIIPLFVAVLIAFGALAIFSWRFTYYFLVSRKE